VPRAWLIATAVCVACAAAAAAVGVPHLVERHHQDEALRELPRLVRSAQVTFVKPRMDPKTGQRAPCEFPQGEIRTTLAHSCCDPKVGDGAGICDPGRIEWNRTLWTSLKWRLTEPHAYVYYYKGEGTFGAARFEVAAYGDLDCDGVYSTFRYRGQGGAASRGDDCIITDQATFEAIDPDE